MVGQPLFWNHEQQGDPIACAAAEETYVRKAKARKTSNIIHGLFMEHLPDQK
jgi:hypothetical protein